MKIISLLSSTLIAVTTMSAASQLIFIGTYTPKDGASRGIYSVRLDTATGALSEPVLAAETSDPTFLALNPNGKVLYALSDRTPRTGSPTGVAESFTIDPATGKLTPLNEQPTGGASLAHIGIDGTGRTLVAISYGAGQITSFPIEADGKIDPKVSFLTSTGPLGPNKARQEKPHTHSVTFSPDDRFAYVCDLGRDKVLRFKINPATSKLIPDGEFAAPPGAGPRHSKFTADGKDFYVINEMGNTITHYSCDPATGDLAVQQSVSTLPDDFTGVNTTAEIRLHPNERFVYGSNRGHDSIAVFTRDPANGKLTRIQIVSSGGAHPRNFCLSADGAWLICANRDTNNIAVFKVDASTGKLTPTGVTANIPKAVCVLFMPAGI
ncbi:MAG: lactonase family protein [Lacunisphaera sp.]